VRIAINGAGVAGPTLAWWLRHHGHDPVLFEVAPKLRTGGYVIDFWGVGFQVAERMGLIPTLREQGYMVNELRLVNTKRRTVASMDTKPIRKLLDDQFLSIARGDIASTIFHACQGVETRFGCSIDHIEQHAHGARVRTTDGSEEDFDLVVGADGLHSRVRELVFGPEPRFERFLGFHVAAFTTTDYQPRDELVYVSCAAPKRSIARFALRNGQTLFLLIFRDQLLSSRPEPHPQPNHDPRPILRNVYADFGWEAPDILARLDDTDDLYFDRVSQIRMDRWTSGRVALVGDAAACVSLLAGEGTGLGMTEAYILAGELHRAQGDHAAAFRAYENKLQPELARKQKSAPRLAGFFAPKNALGCILRNIGTNATSLPILGKLLLNRLIRDNITLPDYT